jgi:hypothetical protein
MTNRSKQAKLVARAANGSTRASSRSVLSVFVVLPALCLFSFFSLVSLTLLNGLPSFAQAHLSNQEQTELGQQILEESKLRARENLKQGEGALTPNDQVRVKNGDNVFQGRNSNEENIKQDDVTRRPLLYWRSWANQRLPFGRVLGLLIIVSLTINFFIEPKIQEAGLIYREKWLRCFSVGILLFTSGMMSAGIMSRMGLFAPVGVLLIATIQLSGLIGLTIGSHAIGDTTLTLLNLSDKFPKPWLKTFTKFTTGCFLLSLFLLLPGAGALPRMGARMLALVAAAGAGSIFMASRSARTRRE